MDKRTPEEICFDLIGQSIDEIEVDYDNEIIVITTSMGRIEFSGDDLAMYVETDKFDG
jgi:hypothetical protein